MDRSRLSKLPQWTNGQVALATTLVLLVGLAFWLLVRFRVAVFILFISIVISIAINPVVEWLHDRRLPRSVGVIAIYLLVAMFVVGFILMALPLVLEQSSQMGEAIPEYYQGFRSWMLSSQSLLVRRLGLELPRYLPWNAAQAQEVISPPAEGAEADDSGAVLVQVNAVLGYAGVIIRSLFTSLAVFLLAFYWTMEGERVIRSLLLLLPQRHREGTRELITEIQVSVGGYIRGIVLLSLLVGGMALVAYFLIGLPYVLSLAIIAGITEAIPIVGPALGAIPPVLIAISTGNTTTVVLVLAAAALIQLSENILFAPRVMNKAVGVNPILILLALATFTSLMGIPGALLAVPIAAVLQIGVSRLLMRMSDAEENVPPERDPLAALRMEIKELTADARKHLREKEGPDPVGNEQVEDAIETLADELDKILVETRLLAEEAGEATQ